MSDGLFDKTIGALNTSLNLRLANQNVISSNVANADTPGYKAKAMEFEGALRDALEAGSGAAVEPEIYEEPNNVHSLDGNTVDRAAEMAKLAENQLLYDASVEALKRKLGMLRYSINEGGGNH